MRDDFVQNNDRLFWMDRFVLDLPYHLWPQYSAKPDAPKVLFRFFETTHTCIVLANSNEAERECNVARCQQDNVPIFRRKGGGGTVVLSPGCLVLTLAFYAQSLFDNQNYFQLINSLWCEALQKLGVRDLNQRGFSDICIGEKKIAGTSLFRRKHLLVFQGSLLVNSNLDLIPRYLSHPSREPDYRGKRSHQDFVTSIKKSGHNLNAAEIGTFCSDYFAKNASEYFEKNIINI